ncbi:MAG: hypothetical protein AB7O59_13510 [Pirellulales bacterium]
MTLPSSIANLRQLFDGFNPPADERAIAKLQTTLGPLPADVLDLYRNHDGQAELPFRDDTWLSCRLVPIAEAIKMNEQCAWFVEGTPALGKITLLWTDDNSNYLGVYTTGELTSWLTVLNHEEPILVPAYRSAGAFYDRLVSTIPGLATEDDCAYDLTMVPRELPMIIDDPQHVTDDRSLATSFRDRYEREPDADMRRLYAMCAMCLTPAADTESLLPFLRDPDMWSPASAVTVLGLRGFTAAVDELERLARDGGANGDSAAMRELVRMDTNAARSAIARLKSSLSGQKLQVLEQWTEPRSLLHPPRWP